MESETSQIPRVKHWIFHEKFQIIVFLNPDESIQLYPCASMEQKSKIANKKQAKLGTLPQKLPLLQYHQSL